MEQCLPVSDNALPNELFDATHLRVRDWTKFRHVSFIRVNLIFQADFSQPSVYF